MGIKYFFKWIKDNFTLKKLKNEKVPVNIDCLLIDLNGIFHSSTQKVFKYGEYKEEKTLFLKPKIETYKCLEEKVFVNVCERIQTIVELVSPKKKLVLCVDGPAPIAKQRQQRGRRFVRALEAETAFDSNAITPGTRFMDHLGRYIDFFIRKQISSKNAYWKEIEVVFSNEKAPGEGEHKLLNYFRKLKNKSDTNSYCIYGMDADLIMLCLATNHSNFYILREEHYEPEVDFNFICIDEIKAKLLSMLNWNEQKEVETVSNEVETKPFNNICAIQDFILMCFLVGNDFLPHMPGMEINQNGLSIMIECYISQCRLYGHITNNDLTFNLVALRMFLKALSKLEQVVFNKKIDELKTCFDDPLLKKNIVSDTVNLNAYKKDYYKVKLLNTDSAKLCHDYIQGLHWVLSYYVQGISNWKWFYPYNYAPFASTLYKHVATFELLKPVITKPTLPFIQLLSVLPPTSNRLIPPPLCGLLTFDGLLKAYCPSKFHIDTDGMKQKWEGVPILPFIDYDEVEKLYLQYRDYIPEKDLKRNKLGRSYVYKYSETGYTFNSYYGTINCYVKTEVIDL